MAIHEEGVTEFDIARKRLRKSAGREAEQRKQSLQRRAAQLGGGTGRGTLLKAEQTVERERGEQVAAGEEAIGAAERAEARRRREIQEQREFITSERVGAQEFARGERLGTQEFSQQQLDTQIAANKDLAVFGRETQERLAGMEIGSREKLAELDRELQREVEAGRIDQAEKDREMKRSQFGEQMSFEQAKLDAQKDQFSQQFGLDTREFELNQETVMFNRLLSAFEAKGGFVKWLQDSGVDTSAMFGEGFTIPQQTAPGGAALVRQQAQRDPRYQELSPVLKAQVDRGQLTIEQAIRFT
jgi:hypothetical protein